MSKKEREHIKKSESTYVINSDYPYGWGLQTIQKVFFPFTLDFLYITEFIIFEHV